MQKFPRYVIKCKISSTGLLRGKFTGHRRIPLTKASNAELFFFLISAWKNGWVNNREASDLRRHRPHYDVILMYKESEDTSIKWVLDGLNLK